MVDNTLHPMRSTLVNEIRLMGNIIAAALEDEPGIHMVVRITTPEDALKIDHEYTVDVVPVSSHLTDQGALK